MQIMYAMVFPVVRYRFESWTIRKTECQRIDAFELWCWRRLLRVPWTARRSNQSILKEISPECSSKAEALVLWPPDVKNWLTGWCWERLKVEGEGDDRGWDGRMASPIQWTRTWANSGRWWGLAYSSPWCRKELNTTWQLNRQTNWMQTYLQCVCKCMLSPSAMSTPLWTHGL